MACQGLFWKVMFPGTGIGDSSPSEMHLELACVRLGHTLTHSIYSSKEVRSVKRNSMLFVQVT